MTDLLASIAVEITGDDAPLNRTMSAAVGNARRQGDRVGSSFAAGFSNPLLNAVASVGSLNQGIAMSIDLVSTLSGMRIAAEFGAYRRQLQGIAGDAKKAEDAFDAFQKIANNSNFDTAQVVGFGVRQAGRTGDVGKAVKDTQTLLDAATAFGVGNNGFDAFQTNVSQIQNRGNSKVDVEDLRQFQNGAPLATKRIADALGISITEASQKLNNATGTQFIDLLNKVGQKNQGAAAAASGADPFAVAANIADSGNSAMEPTGQLFNRVITPVLLGVKSLVDVLGELNKMTGGGAGLTAIVIGGVIVIRRFTGSVAAAVTTTQRLTMALETLAGTEIAMAGATGVRRGTLGGGIGSVAGAAGSLGGALGTVEQIAMFTPVPVGDEGHKNLGNNLRGIGMGWLVDLLDRAKGVGKDGSATSDHAKAMKDHTEALKTSSRVIGGGDRARLSASSFEREYAVYALMHGNAAGVG